MRRVVLAVIAFICVAVIAVVLYSRRNEVVSQSVPLLSGRTHNTQTQKVVSVVASQEVASTQTAVSPNPLRGALSVPDWPQRPTAIRLICGQDNDKGYVARITATHQLGTNLSPVEIQALYWQLHQKYSSQGDLTQESLAALKNDVLDALIRQQPVPADLGAEIIGMYRDRSTDPLWRDYCVQHFALYYDRMWPVSGDGVAVAPVSNDDGRKDILAAFDEALQEKENGNAGAALLGLYSLSGKCPEVTLANVGKNALLMAQDGTCAAQTRVTAVAVCGLTGMTDILPEARILAQTADVLPLRLASIAVLGSLGNAQDTELLEGLRAGSDEKLYVALDAALKKLKTKAGEGK